MRPMGKAAFLDLQDSSGAIQALLRQNNLEDGFDLIKDLDIGDHLGVRGNLIRTRTGQVTIDALELTVTAKGMRPLPEKWHGLSDLEVRYRQRYLDLLVNEDARRIAGHKSGEIGDLLGYRGREELIHRDDLVLS